MDLPAIGQVIRYTTHTAPSGSAPAVTRAGRVWRIWGHGRDGPYIGTDTGCCIMSLGDTWEPVARLGSPDRVLTAPVVRGRSRSSSVVGPQTFAHMLLAHFCAATRTFHFLDTAVTALRDTGTGAAAVSRVAKVHLTGMEQTVGGAVTMGAATSIGRRESRAPLHILASQRREPHRKARCAFLCVQFRKVVCQKRLTVF